MNEYENFDVSGNESDSVVVDVSGNVVVIYRDDTDYSTTRVLSESIQQIQADLSDSDALTNSVFVRYSLSCTLIVCLVILVFNHKR